MDVDERRILTEDEAFRLLAHLIATAELHTIEPPHYAGRRMVEGALPLVDALMRDARNDEAGQAWLRDFRQRTDAALAARRDDPDAFRRFLSAAPGELIHEIKRRRSLVPHNAETGEGSDNVGTT
jgi:hypothetical protein